MTFAEKHKNQNHMDICTKVTLRQRLLKSGKITLYFDYYPPIRNPKTNKMQRHEYLGI